MVTLLKPPPDVATELRTAEEFATHFRAKVNNIRVSTASAPVTVIEPRTIPFRFDFAVVATAEINHGVTQKGTTETLRS